jgi:Protein of unknown function (DUF3164)
MSDIEEFAVPPGWMRMANGTLKQRSTIKPIDLERDILVRGVSEEAKALQAQMFGFKRILAAKALVQECVESWTPGANKFLRTIVEGTWKTNATGQISVGKVLELRQHKIDDARWNLAMEAVADSISVYATATYIRCYERNAEGKYDAIVLDMASL